jgi:hypothetical protein
MAGLPRDDPFFRGDPSASISPRPSGTERREETALVLSIKTHGLDGAFVTDHKKKDCQRWPKMAKDGYAREGHGWSRIVDE